ncbi:MAG TPA: GvpL/GvpF family gas vesicle protein, partial [Blastocatellia bacterium]|nr:GvpL/GvpF family gas vesicle protein [Blastocatellia bacterium]
TTRENVLIHAGVINQVLDFTTPLPFRFGTIVGQDRLDEYVRTNRSSIIAALKRVRGAVEMSVRIIRPQNSKEQLVERTTAAGGGQGKGAEFLVRRRRELMESEWNAGAGEIASWLEERLRGLVRESATRIHGRGAMALTLANLVDRKGLAEYKEQVAMAIDSRNDLRFLTSGPWPPYSFCATSLELPLSR